MSRAPYVFSLVLAAVSVCGTPARAQAVISTHAGLINFVEGAVTLDGQPVEARVGKFQMVPERAELRTAQGRAEVLLTPGVFLRLGENSAMRMISGVLADTRVELLAGSAILDAAEPSAGTSVTMQFGTWSVRQKEKGAYRVDARPARVIAQAGEVEIFGADGVPVRLQAGMEMPLAQVLVPQAAGAQAPDALDQWAEGRAESVAADDAIAEGIQDPGSMTAPAGGLLAGADLPDGFTYFPMLGLPTADPALSAYGYPGSIYGMAGPQLGFYSVYLPGYSYRPMLLGLPGLGMTGYGLRGAGVRGLTLRELEMRVGGAGLPHPGYPSLPERIGGTRFGATPYPAGGVPVHRPTMAPPPARPPMPARAAPHMAPRMGGRR